MRLCALSRTQPDKTCRAAMLLLRSCLRVLHRLQDLLQVIRTMRLGGSDKLAAKTIRLVCQHRLFPLVFLGLSAPHRYACRRRRSFRSAASSLAAACWASSCSGRRPPGAGGRCRSAVPAQAGEHRLFNTAAGTCWETEHFPGIAATFEIPSLHKNQPRHRPRTGPARTAKVLSSFLHRARVLGAANYARRSCAAWKHFLGHDGLVGLDRAASLPAAPSPAGPGEPGWSKMQADPPGVQGCPVGPRARLPGSSGQWPSGGPGPENAGRSP